MTILNVNSKRKSLSSTVLKNRAKLTLLACLPLISLHAIASDEDNYYADKNQKVSQTMAVSEDASILAKELGIETEEVEASLAFQEKFELLVKKIMKVYPNKIARIWIEPGATQKAHIQFVGDSPRISTNLDVEMFDGGLYSVEEQNDRANYLSKLLKAQNYSNFMTYFDHRDGKIKLEMKSAKNAKTLNFDSLKTLLADKSSKLGGDENAAIKNLSIDDIDFEMMVGDGEIYELEYARGGEWLRDDGVRECTSGWAVSGPHGNGIITAAHCVGLNELEHSYTSSHPDMTWRSQERGNGDVEYHTTNHAEIAEYYATGTRTPQDIRDVTGIKWTFLMFTGQSVCEYGRSSNTRTCGHNVISNNVTVTFTDGVTVSNLVRVSGDNSIGGDSGGPWSWGTVAWGVHSGSNNIDSFFTPIQKAQSELNVTILTK